jgi:excisionase family DNA binding protein
MVSVCLSNISYPICTYYNGIMKIVQLVTREVNMEEQKLVLTVEEAGKRIGLSRPSAYQAVRRGEIPSLRFGKRLVVPLAAFEKMLASAAAASGLKT